MREEMRGAAAELLWMGRCQPVQCAKCAHLFLDERAADTAKADDALERARALKRRRAAADDDGRTSAPADAQSECRAEHCATSIEHRGEECGEQCAARCSHVRDERWWRSLRQRKRRFVMERSRDSKGVQATGWLRATSS